MKTKIGISATELRIGNWIYNVSSRKEIVVTVKTLLYFSGIYYKPIPITPKRLERAGFEPNGKNRWMMTGILFDIVFNSISDPEFIGRSEGY